MCVTGAAVCSHCTISVPFVLKLPFVLKRLSKVVIKRVRWEQRLGKCYFALAMMRDAEEALNNSLRAQPMLSSHFDLAKVREG